MLSVFKSCSNNYDYTDRIMFAASPASSVNNFLDYLLAPTRYTSLLIVVMVVDRGATALLSIEKGFSTLEAFKSNPNLVFIS